MNFSLRVSGVLKGPASVLVHVAWLLIDSAGSALLGCSLFGRSLWAMRLGVSCEVNSPRSDGIDLLVVSG